MGKRWLGGKKMTRGLSALRMLSALLGLTGACLVMAGSCAQAEEGCRLRNFYEAATTKDVNLCLGSLDLIERWEDHWFRWENHWSIGYLRAPSFHSEDLVNATDDAKANIEMRAARMGRFKVSLRTLSAMGYYNVLMNRDRKGIVDSIQRGNRVFNLENFRDKWDFARDIAQAMLKELNGDATPQQIRERLSRMNFVERQEWDKAQSYALWLKGFVEAVNRVEEKHLEFIIQKHQLELSTAVQ